MGRIWDTRQLGGRVRPRLGSMDDFLERFETSALAPDEVDPGE